MPTLIPRPWLSPTRSGIVLKAAREGLALSDVASPNPRTRMGGLTARRRRPIYKAA
jgi:hypothetical protein